MIPFSFFCNMLMRYMRVLIMREYDWLWSEILQIFKTSMLSVYVSMERWTLWDFKDFWMRICMQVMHVEESHNIKSYSCFLPVICDSAYVFGLIFQDIHRRPQDSAWICVRAWWHWWMYPQIWRIRVRKGFQGSVFQMSFVYYRVSHFIKCFMMLFNTTTQLRVTGRLSEFECFCLWKRALFLRVIIHRKCNIFYIFVIKYSISKMHI